MGRYVGGEAIDIASANHPVNSSVASANRTWSDANRNYVPDCDLRNPLANGECGTLDNLNFGRNNPNAYRYDPNLLNGWRKRNFTWQAQAFLQHELVPNVGVTFGYFRTWYGNFRVTANRALSPADFDSYCIASPSDSRFAVNSGSPICGLFDVKPAKFGQSQQVVEPASNYGDYTEVYDGFDLIASARLKKLYLTGGLNTGRTEVDYCGVVTGNPQVVPFRRWNCRQPWNSDSGDGWCGKNDACKTSCRRDGRFCLLPIWRIQGKYRHRDVLAQGCQGRGNRHSSGSETSARSHLGRPSQ